jgi:hypothetical protein
MFPWHADRLTLEASQHRLELSLRIGVGALAHSVDLLVDEDKVTSPLEWQLRPDWRKRCRLVAGTVRKHKDWIQLTRRCRCREDRHVQPYASAAILAAVFRH